MMLGMKRIGVLTPLLVIAVLLGALALVGVSFMLISDRMSMSEDRVWGAIGLAVAVAMTVAGLATAHLLLKEARSSQRVAFLTLKVSLLGIVGLIFFGLLQVVAVKQRGGDYGSLAVGLARLFGIYFPVCLGSICLVLHFRLRRIAIDEPDRDSHSK